MDEIFKKKAAKLAQYMQFTLLTLFALMTSVRRIKSGATCLDKFDCLNRGRPHHGVSHSSGRKARRQDGLTRPEQAGAR